MTLESHYRIDVIEAYQRLNTCLNDFVQAMSNDQKLPAWTEADGLTSAARTASLEAIGQLEYVADQPPKETLTCAGLIAASENTIACIQALNEAKQQFKTAMIALKAAKIPIHDPSLLEHFEETLKVRDAKTRASLRKIGLARLHLKQCYRKIPLLAERPDRVSLTWAHTRAIKRMSAADCIALLHKKSQDAGILQQIEKANTLSQDTPLAIVQELAPHLRANVVFEDQGETRRLMLKASLPVFYPHESGTGLPKVKAAGSKQEKNPLRAQRVDLKIAPEPFLPAIRAHCYL